MLKAKTFETAYGYIAVINVMVDLDNVNLLEGIRIISLDDAFKSFELMGFYVQDLKVEELNELIKVNTIGMANPLEEQIKLAKELLRSEGYHIDNILHKNYFMAKFTLEKEYEEEMTELIESAIDEDVYDLITAKFEEVLRDEEIKYKRI